MVVHGPSRRIILVAPNLIQKFFTRNDALGILYHAPQLPPSVRPSKVFDTYWRFAAERQEIFFRRLAGAPPPWTADPILREFKFTNAYRASDRVSQYLIRRVIYPGDQNPDELIFRILVFEMFNRIETWELLRVVSRSQPTISTATTPC